MKASKNKKLLVIGLDCAAPQFVFDAFYDDLPNLKSLMESGIYGELKSCHPPITVPAWTVMTSSKNPGKLGFYGFRNRADYSYGKMSYADSTAVREDRVWDILSRIDRNVVVLGVPQTYPPRWVNGLMVGCFLTPNTDSNYTFPIPLKEEIKNVVGDYMLDVKDFRTDDKDYLIAQINEMTDKRFKLAKHFLKEKPWDFFMMVEMGPDRLHHGLWKYTDCEHRKFEKNSPYAGALREYYKRLDAHIGEMLALIDRDNTDVMVVSDHGAKRMEGGVCLNEWLIKEGYLTLKKMPEKPVALEKCEVDWEKTIAWGAGGYYGRLFMNVQGREPNGVIPAGDYEKVREELIGKIEDIRDENGLTINTSAFKPQDLYPEVRGIAPDLIIYFGDLFWRSVGQVGGGEILTFDNDTGPDDANHDYCGIFILSGPGVEPKGRLHDLDIINCAPTMLKLMGVPVPADMEGKSMV